MMKMNGHKTTVKIIDFGLAVVHNPDIDPPLTAFAGSAFTVAPEVIQRQYSSICDSTSNQCSTALGLSCTNSFYSCDCPTELPGYRCDCGPTQYYKDSLGCQSRVTHGQACSGTHMCMPNLNLICSSSVCTCIDDYYWTGSICSMFLTIHLLFYVNNGYSIIN